MWQEKNLLKATSYAGFEKPILSFWEAPGSQVMQCPLLR